VAVLAMVTAYYALVALVVRRHGPQHVSVARYQPPSGVSPGVAARLLEHTLARAVAAALVNMAAKGYVKIEQSADLCSVTQLHTRCAASLEPEEDALSYRLFRVYDAFDFDELNPHWIRGVKAFQTALLDTTFFFDACGLVDSRLDCLVRGCIAGHGEYAILAPAEWGPRENHPVDRRSHVCGIPFGGAHDARHIRENGHAIARQ
jgi:Predicted membrane protein (DUF2207)